MNRCIVCPRIEIDKLRLTQILDIENWQELLAQLNRHQRVVSERFAAVFADAETPDEQQSAETSADQNAAIDSWAVMSSMDVEEPETIAALASIGIVADQVLLDAIASVCRGAFYQRLTARAQQRVDHIVPLLLTAVQERDAAATTLTRCLRFVRAVAGRSGYLQALIDRPPVLAHLVGLFADSIWLANFVTRQPIVVDELLNDTHENLWPDKVAVREEVMAAVSRLGAEDLDVQMDGLRQFRQARELRIVVAELTGSLPLMKVSDQLTWLAESLVEGVLQLVREPLEARYGQPMCIVDGESQTIDLGVIAYGKLGGIELGFGSDLDLVFVHSCSGSQQQTNGDQVVENSVFHARLAQKFVHFMTTTTPAGVLYEIDLRLRPNGTSGVLVTSIDSFSQYQRGDAWTWEHQALMRARAILGGPVLIEQFNQIRAGVLGQQRSVDELKQAVSSMRQRMRDALGNKDEQMMHLKQDTGGVADIEFVVQYLVLANAVNHPSLLDYTDNVRVLEELARLDLLAVETAESLTESYLQLRARLHRRALQEADSVVAIDAQLQQLIDTVVTIRNNVLGTTS